MDSKSVPHRTVLLSSRVRQSCVAFWICSLTIKTRRVSEASRHVASLTGLLIFLSHIADYWDFPLTPARVACAKWAEIRRGFEWANRLRVEGDMDWQPSSATPNQRHQALQVERGGCPAPFPANRASREAGTAVDQTGVWLPQRDAPRMSTKRIDRPSLGCGHLLGMALTVRFVLFTIDLTRLGLSLQAAGSQRTRRAGRFFRLVASSNAPAAAASFAGGVPIVQRLIPRINKFALGLNQQAGKRRVSMRAHWRLCPIKRALDYKALGMPWQNRHLR